MLKKKELSKKKNLLMVLWDECIAFKVLFFILAYVAIAFINMPLEKWLEAHSTEFLQGLTHEKTNFIENSFIVLPIFEALAVALIYLIVMITAIFHLQKMKSKKWNLKMQMNILLMFLTCFLMVSKKKKISMLVMRNLKRCL